MYCGRRDGYKYFVVHRRPAEGPKPRLRLAVHALSRFVPAPFFYPALIYFYSLYVALFLSFYPALDHPIYFLFFCAKARAEKTSKAQRVISISICYPHDRLRPRLLTCPKVSPILLELLIPPPLCSQLLRLQGETHSHRYSL